MTSKSHSVQNLLGHRNFQLTFKVECSNVGYSSNFANIQSRFEFLELNERIWTRCQNPFVNYLKSQIPAQDFQVSF